MLEEETNRSIGSEGKEFKAGLARVLAASQQYADAGKEFSRCEFCVFSIWEFLNAVFVECEIVD